MSCKEWTAEIVEAARSGAAPGEALAGHLAGCAGCAARWGAERQLSRDFGTMRSVVSSLPRSVVSGLPRSVVSSLPRSVVSGLPRSVVASLPRGDAARARLMAACDARRSGSLARYKVAWAVAAVAALLLAAVEIAPRRSGRPAMVAQSDTGFEETIADNGFVPVPYAPPLAPGEIVEVVRMDLTPAAFARMGFVLQAAYGNEVTAELAVGQDGLPRAIRVPESVEIRY